MMVHLKSGVATSLDTEVNFDLWIMQPGIEKQAGGGGGGGGAFHEYLEVPLKVTVLIESN